MTAPAPIAVTGWSLHVPADPDAGLPALAGAGGTGAGVGAGNVGTDNVGASNVGASNVGAGGAGAADAEAVPPQRAHELLGRKGLLGKDAATRLALCAIHRALGLAPGAPRAGGPPDPDTAVVASSNLGNLSSVVDIVHAVRTGGRRAVSPLAVPNASSNVIASTAAIWFRFGGPNLMVCSGATAGLDAVALGMLLLRSRRAGRVIVVGAEPADAVATSMYRQAAPTGRELRAGAACVVLAHANAHPHAPVLSDVHNGLAPGGATLELGDRDLYGALGVALVAMAADRVRDLGGVIRIGCGDDIDGWRDATVSADRTTAE